MDERASLLVAYDEQLRIDAETPGAVSVVIQGPLHLLRFAGGRGLVTYRDLGDLDRTRIDRSVSDVLAYFKSDPVFTTLEWKTRGHDRAAGLHEALINNGFLAHEPESIMLGAAHLLATPAQLPEGVTMRAVTREPDVLAMCAMQCDVFGDDHGAELTRELLRRLSLDDGMQLWIAEAAGQIVGAGRLEPVAGTDFAGIWGGATRPDWRHRGIYRALTATRAGSALRMGKSLINSDCTEYSRSILERSGLLKVSTTTPYVWNSQM